MITRYGYDVVAVVGIIALAGTVAVWTLQDGQVLRYAVTGVLLLLLAFTLNFFRDPERETPRGDALVIAPADGTVIDIRDVREDEYMRGDAVQISIFMSPLNVHVNRFPISGRVEYFRYHPGEYLMAFDEKSSLRNERTHIGVGNGRTKVLFKQIAGFIARRIIAEVREGDTVTAGTRFGMIRFGSRVDVFVPRGSAVNVARGEATVAGETVLATVP
jgi:phosphatidylserine decarboxylase